METRTHTRGQRKTSQSVWHKSTITDHATQQNHVIDWEGAKILEKEEDHKTRLIKDSIWIRTTPQNCST